jgi:hypothetical protein
MRGVVRIQVKSEKCSVIATAITLLSKEMLIRFSTSSKEFLRNLARITVRKVTASKQFNLSRLPTEIRLQIFEELGLVAPGDLEWKAKGDRPGFNLHLNYFLRDHICIAVKGWIHSRGAYATSCQCWVFPVELFLLNKEYHAIATQVFYSKNQFIILPDRGYNLPGDITLDFQTHQPTPSYSSFFTSNPHSAIKHLRSL